MCFSDTVLFWYGHTNSNLWRFLVSLFWALWNQVNQIQKDDKYFVPVSLDYKMICSGDIAQYIIKQLPKPDSIFTDIVILLRAAKGREEKTPTV